MPTDTQVQSAFDTAKANVAEKVRKLLAQAEDPACTTEEAEAFSAKAQQLITKFSIDLSILGEGKRSDELITKKVWVNGPYHSAKVSLAHVVVRNNDCRCVWGTAWITDAEGNYVRDKDGKVTKRAYVAVVGYATDVEWVETLYASLEHQLTYAVARDKKTRYQGENLRSWTTSYIDGFTSAINARLREARRKVEAEVQEKVNADRRELLAAALDTDVVPEATSVALVLVQKNEKVEAEYKRRYPGTRTTYRKGGSSFSGRSAGANAGRNASLARGGVTSGRALGR